MWGGGEWTAKALLAEALNSEHSLTFSCVFLAISFFALFLSTKPVSVGSVILIGAMSAACTHLFVLTKTFTEAGGEMERKMGGENVSFLESILKSIMLS